MGQSDTAILNNAKQLAQDIWLAKLPWEIPYVIIICLLIVNILISWSIYYRTKKKHSFVYNDNKIWNTISFIATIALISLSFFMDSPDKVWSKILISLTGILNLIIPIFSHKYVKFLNEHLIFKDDIKEIKKNIVKTNSFYNIDYYKPVFSKLKTVGQDIHPENQGEYFNKFLDINLKNSSNFFRLIKSNLVLKEVFHSNYYNIYKDTFDEILYGINELFMSESEHSLPVIVAKRIAEDILKNDITKEQKNTTEILNFEEFHDIYIDSIVIDKKASRIFIIDTNKEREKFENEIKLMNKNTYWKEKLPNGSGSIFPTSSKIPFICWAVEWHSKNKFNFKFIDINKAETILGTQKDFSLNIIENDYNLVLFVKEYQNLKNIAIRKIIDREGTYLDKFQQLEEASANYPFDSDQEITTIYSQNLKISQIIDQINNKLE